MNLPIFEELYRAQTVLLAGAGGGFDVFAGLPLYFALRKAGKNVHLANLSFTELAYCEGERLVPSLMRITAQTQGPANYFPEGHLARWLTDHFGEETPVYAIERNGVRPVATAYEYLVQVIKPDTLLLVDGGMDSLMRGDEAGLGTPEEDIASLIGAGETQGVARKLLVSIGFGVDTFHGVCHAHFLENVARLIGEDGYLGAWSLMKDSEEFRLYQQAYAYVESRMPRRPSIVNTSIIGAVNGHYGDQHTTTRTEGSKLFINPLMALCWAFKLEEVLKQNYYADAIRGTKGYTALTIEIERYRAGLEKLRQWEDIPC